MAVTPIINGYPVLEANVLKSRITGRIWSQYELDKNDFVSDLAYNGMILAVDDATKSVKFPAGTTTADEVYALHFSAEAEYEHRGLIHELRNHHFPNFWILELSVLYNRDYFL